MMRHRETDAITRQVVDLFEAYHEPIFAYLYRLTGDAEWAHDLTQESFLRVYETRRKLTGINNTRAWIYRIASNIAFNAIKRRRRFRWLSWRDEDVLHDAGMSAAGPENEIDVERRVGAALASMTPVYRAPLLLFTQFDFSVKEIAEALDISESATKTRLFRAREMFRAAYEVGHADREGDK